MRTIGVREGGIGSKREFKARRLVSERDLVKNVSIHSRDFIYDTVSKDSHINIHISDFEGMEWKAIIFLMFVEHIQESEFKIIKLKEK